MAKDLLPLTPASQGLRPETTDWLAFPGGELEGQPPAAKCAACRRARRSGRPSRAPICFQCYREGLRREQAMRAAAELETASETRFQWTLPFEPVHKPRLESLKALRATERTTHPAGREPFDRRRRHAQLKARHLLRMLEAGLRNERATRTERERVFAGAIRAAELQFPESWLPFVVAR